MNRLFIANARFVRFLFAASVALSGAMGCTSESTEPFDPDPRARAAKCEKNNPAEPIGLEALATWNILGLGKTDILQAEDGPVLDFRGQTESPDSIVLLSPTRYAEDMILRFQIRFLVPRSIVVMILSASTPGTGEDLSLPEGPQGWWFWGHRKHPRAQSYLFSIHTAFHQPDALMRRRPQTRESPRAATPDTLTEEGRWYSVEVGRMGGFIWLDNDGKPLLSGTDPDPLPRGHVGFLFTGDGDASVQIRDVSIVECPAGADKAPS